jgi:hypothetical protein
MTKHVLTNKHKKALNPDVVIKCIDCNKTFKHESSLSRHKLNKCVNKIISLESKINDQQRQINEMTPIHVTQNTQNNIKINSYRNTDYSHLTDNTFIHALTKGLMCGNELIKQVHFNKDLPENHNISLTNLRGDFMKIMTNDKWTVVDKRTHLESLLETADDLLTDWLETADKQHKDRHEIITDRSINQTEHILKTFKLMLYNLCT